MPPDPDWESAAPAPARDPDWDAAAGDPDWPATGTVDLDAEYEAEVERRRRASETPDPGTVIEEREFPDLASAQAWAKPFTRPPRTLKPGEDAAAALAEGNREWDLGEHESVSTEPAGGATFEEQFRGKWRGRRRKHAAAPKFQPLDPSEFVRSKGLDPAAAKDWIEQRARLEAARGEGHRIGHRGTWEGMTAGEKAVVHTGQVAKSASDALGGVPEAFARGVVAPAIEAVSGAKPATREEMGEVFAEAERGAPGMSKAMGTAGLLVGLAKNPLVKAGGGGARALGYGRAGQGAAGFALAEGTNQAAREARGEGGTEGSPLDRVLLAGTNAAAAGGVLGRLAPRLDAIATRIGSRFGARTGAATKGAIEDLVLKAVPHVDGEAGIDWSLPSVDASTAIMALFAGLRGRGLSDELARRGLSRDEVDAVEAEVERARVSESVAAETARRMADPVERASMPGLAQAYDAATAPKPAEAPAPPADAPKPAVAPEAAPAAPAPEAKPAPAEAPAPPRAPEPLKSGDAVRGTTREGEAVEGTLVRATEKSLVLETPAGRRRVVAETATLADPADRGDVGNARLPLSVEPTPEHAGKKPIGPQEVIEHLGDVVDAPIRSGRMRSRDARGEFKIAEEAIRVRESNNIPTATHEVGHALSKEAAIKAGIDDPAVRRDLISLGKALYGNRKPNGGYAEEGVAELVRLYVTNPAELAKAAPKAGPWFDRFLASDAGSDYAGPLAAAREAAARYAGQGSHARAEGGMVLGRAGRAAWQGVKDFFSAKNQIEEFAPLKAFRDAVEKIEGKKLDLRDDPYEVASAARMSGPAKVRDWIEGQGVTDVAGTVISSMNLDTAIAPAVRVDPGLKGFRAYLWARHALDMHDRGLNPGLAKVDAEHIVAGAGPEFQIAAENVYGWRRAVLESAKSAGLLTDSQVAAMRAKWPHSVPLERVFDEPHSALFKARRPDGSPIKRLKGSGKRIRDPLAVMIEQAVRLQRAADRYRVLGAIARHSHREGGPEGIGRVIEEVPRDKVPHTMTIESIRKQLQEAGADLSEADLEATITHFADAQFPKGVDPIFPLRKADGTTTWYHVDPGLWESLEGLDVYQLPKALDVTLGALKRGLVLGTTGLRPAFGMVRNPARDLPTFLMQSSANPVEAGKAYALAAAEVLKGVTGKGESPYYDLFKRLGASMAQPLASDSRQVRRAVKGLGKDRVWKTVRSPVEALRDVIQWSEAIPRVAELKVVADRLGWDGKRPLTESESIELALAARRVTTDFSAGGKVGKVVNAMAAFFNPTIQGTRTMARAFRANPKGAVLRGLTTITAPTIALWLANKDEDWYRDMTPEEKFTYWHFAGERENVRVPRPYEWGNLFSVLPEAILDSAYQENPKVDVWDALWQVVKSTTPDPINNPAVKVPLEQARNKVAFTGAAIVPRAEQDMPAHEQFGPETSRVAKGLGRLLDFSPRRIDHAIRGVFGGLGADAAALTGTGRKDREWEPADLPVVGTLFKRGGKQAGRSAAVDAVYEKAQKAIERGNSRERPESPAEAEDRKRLTAATTVLTMVSRALPEAREDRTRQALLRLRRSIAVSVEKGGPPPEPKDIREMLESMGLLRPKDSGR